jgi:hypothetical protein
VNIHLKLPQQLHDEITTHLRQPHPVALERVGFVACAGGNSPDGMVLLARSFHPVRDEDYQADELVGARISSRAIQSALALAYGTPLSMLFVHEHAHRGKPNPSRVDLNCWRELSPNFWHVRPELPHGGLILSHDSAMGLVWVPHETNVFPITKFTIVGRHLGRWSEAPHA